jgi:hypothetical protein
MKRLSILLISASLLYGNYEAKNVTQKDLDLLKSIDRHIYDLMTKENKLEVGEVVSFITQNLIFELDYTPLKVKVQGRLQNQNTSSYDETGELNQDKNSYRLRLILEYPILDKQEKLQRYEKRVSTKQTIIRDVETYFKLKSKINDLLKQIKFLTLLETRNKVRKLTGTGAFTDWLENLQNIKDKKHELELSKIEAMQQKEILISYVKDEAKQYLRGKL